METRKLAIGRSGGGEGLVGGEGATPSPLPPGAPALPWKRLGHVDLKPSAPTGKHAGGGERQRSGGPGEDGVLGDPKSDERAGEVER